VAVLVQLVQAEMRSGRSLRRDLAHAGARESRICRRSFAALRRLRLTEHSVAPSSVMNEARSLNVERRSC
jgi:hypothetical protein